MNPIYTNAPTFVKSVPNAQLWYVGGGDDIINVVHLWGLCPSSRLDHCTHVREQEHRMRWATRTGS